MKFVIQRVKKAEVVVENAVVGKIDHGFLVLIGITHTDNQQIADKMISKLVNMRIFEDENEKMNLALKDVGGSLLLVSQFTLYSNCKHGNRPEFLSAAKPVQAEELYNYIVEECRKTGIKVETGIFRADMQVSSINNGPVTIILDSANDLKLAS